MAPTPPLILEPEALQALIGNEQFLIADLSKPDTYAQAHIPGAVHLDYAQIVAMQRPVMGLLPDEARLNAVLSSIGLTRDHHVVAYDDEGGGRAARLLWTLSVLGHENYSLLNGGLHAWAGERRPLQPGPESRPHSQYHGTRNDTVIADRNYILERLGDPSTAFLDARSPEEYRGSKRFAERGGHIPGALNLDWVTTMDPARGLRLRPAEELKALLASLGATPDREIICYCQSHHRSAHSFILLKSLGYPRLRGYPGSWSDWGNRPETPVEP